MSKPWLNFYDDEVPNELVIPPLTLPDLLRNAANNYPNQIATLYMGGQLTYRQLQQEVEKLAAGLYHLGISKGDRVAIMMPNCPQCIIAYYAVVSLGGVVVMTNPLYVERELEHQWGDAQVEIVISLDIFWPRIQAVQQKLPLTHVILSGVVYAAAQTHAGPAGTAAAGQVGQG